MTGPIILMVGVVAYCLALPYIIDEFRRRMGERVEYR